MFPLRVHPGWHAMPHWPAVQDANPEVGTGHLLSQLPHVVGASRLTQVLVDEHAEVPLGQLIPHWAPAHVGNPPVAEHAVPQLPQSYGSVTRSTHRSVHIVSGGVQDATHVP